MLTIECDELLDVHDDTELILVSIPVECLTLGDELDD